MNTTLTFERISMPGASLGEENPLPDIPGFPDAHSDVPLDPSIPPEQRRYFNYGRVNSILPYRKQDGYDRNQTPREYDGVVLENKYLRAVFFPQFGGKLWSLYDKERGRPLLHENPVFQPANLALRNAWTSGGVEWNLGMTGHSPLTLSPLHTAVLALDDGTPVLRMYEWERIRRISFQLDCYLPEDSRFLFVRVRLRNTRDETVPVYWWSNIAVDETPDSRVLAPADTAFCYDYSRVITKRPVPLYEGMDSSYTTRIPRAMDLFFDLPPAQRKWEAVLDGKGEGLVQTSTDLLQGRKLFLWGNSAGGRHWQEFLAAPGKAYLEIQAGLANTQMEHLPMPANAGWEWLEAYGPMRADPQRVHSQNWQEAYGCVDARLETELPRKFLDAELARLAVELEREEAPLRCGSGWAALELRRVGLSDCFPGEKARFTAASLTKEQQPWLELLETGAFPARAPSEYPAAYLTQEEWIPLLEEAVRSGRSDHWHAWLQLGVMYCAREDWENARKAFETSFARTGNAWAKRNLAMLESENAAANLLLEAVEMLPVLPIAVECGQFLLKAQRWADFVDFYDQLPCAVQLHGRLRAMRAQAAIELEEFDYALEILTNGTTVCDMREGEVLLSDLWVELHARRLGKQEGLPVDDALRARAKREFPIPEELDFRMKNED